MISHKITTIKEPLEIDLQLMATELDTSVNDIRFISKSIINDGIEIEAFESLCKDIEEDGCEITSLNDNTVLYEYLEDAVVLHTVLGEKYILFDKLVKQKIENKMDSFK